MIGAIGVNILAAGILAAVGGAMLLVQHRKRPTPSLDYGAYAAVAGAAAIVSLMSKGWELDAFGFYTFLTAIFVSYLAWRSRAAWRNKDEVDAALACLLLVLSSALSTKMAELTLVNDTSFVPHVLSNANLALLCASVVASLLVAVAFIRSTRRSASTEPDGDGNASSGESEGKP